jgi:hypothetical protein
VTLDVTFTLPPCRYYFSHLYSHQVSIGFEVSWGLQLIHSSTYVGGSNDLTIFTYPPPCNTVYVIRVDPSVLPFILSLHQHSYRSTPFNSHFNLKRKNMSTSTTDLIGTCACVQEVQIKWILTPEFSFLTMSPMCLPQYSSTMYHSYRELSVLRQFKTNSLFSLVDVYFRSRWDY